MLSDCHLTLLVEGRLFESKIPELGEGPDGTIQIVRIFDGESSVNLFLSPEDMQPGRITELFNCAIRLLERQAHPERFQRMMKALERAALELVPPQGNA